MRVRVGAGAKIRGRGLKVAVDAEDVLLRRGIVRPRQHLVRGRCRVRVGVGLVRPRQHLVRGRVGVRGRVRV